ncbi:MULTISPECIES: hypothetical protein [Hydrogenophaga]|uniref:hypothetical protein n=1 Tax=Hydrogenophaga TaxID=47420 RepID=UPI001CFA87CB|nr:MULTISPECIES: hypothetical protein [Hydrogenophaga]MDO9029914.1 hypothetical protein [Hydrogenophaga sp.]UCU94510.1 hypothetical protein KI616_01085 [Hydrogenophaga taeniospiralis]
MPIKTAPSSPAQEVHWGSDIASVKFDGRCLVVLVAREPLEGHRFRGLQVTFESATGFRFLDELDLARYWSSAGFVRGHHVLSVTAGGWAAEETQVQGWERPHKEWLVVTGNGCLNVFANEAPKTAEGEFESEA